MNKTGSPSGLPPAARPVRGVIVTGGAAGIGRATALRFARAGDAVVLLDVRDEEGATVAREIVAAGGRARFLHVDVTDAEAVDAAVAEVADRFGRIDVLVNNAGIVRDAQLVKWKDGAAVGQLSEADFEAVVDVNLKGVFLCGRSVTPHLIRCGGGVILNATSVVALTANFGQTCYAAAKSGVISMTRTWARELGRHGIRVNAVAPGFIDTEMLLTIPEPLRRKLVEHTPLGRLGRPEEVAEAYFWLASEAASFVTGTVLSVDGGVVLGT